jgi:hypothetical protein
VSRFRQALAAAVMAAAAAGSGLLIAAASTTPASASARPVPHRAHMITITARPAAHAASRIGPHDILPCTTKPGAAVKPASCGDQTISCVIIAGEALSFEDSGTVWTTSDSTVQCSSPVTSISMQSSLLLNGIPVTTAYDDTQGIDHAHTTNLAGCQAGTWNTGASAFITFPPGYVLTAGTNPIHDLSSGLSVPAGFCNPGGGGGSGGGSGGGGGGGCAVHSPSLAGHPAGRHPDFVACQ